MPEPMRCEGVVYSKLGNHNQALQDLNQAAYLDADDVQIKISRAVVRTEIGDAIGAINDFTQFYKPIPDLAAAYVGRAWPMLNCQLSPGDRGLFACITALIPMMPNLLRSGGGKGQIRGSRRRNPGLSNGGQSII
jgi:tetratricopeptide (TPR) repeat protein